MHFAETQVIINSGIPCISPISDKLILQNQINNLLFIIVTLDAFFVVLPDVLFGGREASILTSMPF